MVYGRQRQSHLRQTCDVFKAIADPSRRQMLDMLTAKELTVSDLMAPFTMSQPAVSKHLRVLREAGLVRETKVGRHRFYRLQPQPLLDVARWLAHYESFWRARFEVFTAMLNEESS